MENKLTKLYLKMIEYFEGDPKRIQSFTKVYSFARIIGSKENLDNDSRIILEATALVNSAGIKKAEELYGSCSNKQQEEFGPDIVKSFLIQLMFTPEQIERICYIVGHSHSYNKIDGIDFQIFAEADLLVKLYEDNADKPSILKAYDTIFKTETGKEIARKMFHIIDF